MIRPQPPGLDEAMGMGTGIASAFCRLWASNGMAGHIIL